MVKRLTHCSTSKLRQLLELLADRADRADHLLHPLPWALPVPLRVNGRYSPAEVLTAFDAVDDRGAPRSHREGVLWHQPTATDLLFVTVDLLVDLPAGASLFNRVELKSVLEDLLLTRVDLIRRNLKPELKATVEAEAIPL
ncbi:MAG: hypothetical protein VKM34_04220 [Cyanobacteriota bacterium]|nr:hypothetical protein [Cyanobacteriota bacterium]